MSSRGNERAAYKSRRAQDKEWWKPLDRLPERMRVQGRRLVKRIRLAWNSRREGEGSCD